MDGELVVAIVFIVFMGLFLWHQRKKVEVKKILFPFLYFVMYRSSAGLRLMDRIGRRFERLLKGIVPFMIALGFLGMIVISYSLVSNLFLLFKEPAAASGVGLVLPIKAKGIFYVPFSYWIISIFIIAGVHELSHGIFARVYKMKVKSSGFAFLNVFVPVIPAAFVEPDEKELSRRPAKEQLAVFAAGPFANVVFALIFLGVFFLLAPLGERVVGVDGVIVDGLAEGDFPAQRAGILPGDLILSVDSYPVVTMQNLSLVLESKKPGDNVTLKTNRSIHSVVLGQRPENASRPYLGANLVQHFKINKDYSSRYGEFSGRAFLWLLELLFFLYFLNIGIGLFNLAPIGPLDGGRMLLVGLQKYLPEARARALWKHIGIVLFAVILVSMLFVFLR
mgnify:CR=1 FL=1